MKMKRKYSKKKEMGVRRSPRDLVKKKMKRIMMMKMKKRMEV